MNIYQASMEAKELPQRDADILCLFAEGLPDVCKDVDPVMLERAVKALLDGAQAMEERDRIKEKYIKLYRAAIAVWRAYGQHSIHVGQSRYLESPIFQLYRNSKVVKKPLTNADASCNASAQQGGDDDAD